MIHSGKMKYLKIGFVVFITAAVLAVTAFFLIGYLKPKPAGIYVDASPSASVYINNEFVGKTPVAKTLSAGNINIRMVPDITDQDLFPFETKVNLVPGIQTVIRREFGTTEDSSSGDIISFEPDTTGIASLVVISTPDNSQISIDGTPRGFAPYKISDISPAKHQISVKADGYADRIMTITTKIGYRLTLFAKLAKSGDSQNTQATPTPTPDTQKIVTVLNTPTGYLRVRTQPGTKGEEIGQVKPGDKFPYLNTDTESGWLEIQFEEAQPGLPNGITGWISNQYATVSAGLLTH